MIMKVTFAAMAFLLAAAAAACNTVEGVGQDAQAAGEAMGSFVWLGAAVLTRTAAWVDYAPWSTWRVPSPATWLVASYYAAAVLALWLARPTRHPLQRRPIGPNREAVAHCFV